ncbi:DNA (cytosine-5-)-methyltransferase [Mariluticola halotolerans]|uniref:DNA (cytosine-5-)-methyltransferase n=1 Tax=Mariluticola halotolerans TaxID=2909283 RepID=UPI0026E2FDF4|nr:DNA (cytosine-5-)-methyltransferase [Mariluticola halotolerans]UJQ94463.1 DNA (cytosine-5-)-methyltransferase [Mariluticola halotolerans]
MTKFQLLREQAGMSVAEAAKYLGLSEKTIRRYDSGESSPRPGDILALETEGVVTQPVKKAAQTADFSFIDLFAGIGGLRRGFESIGGRCVFTSEWDKYARETYSANYRDNREPAGDVREFSETPGLIPEHDVLLAGFPCQPFSIAGVSKKNSLGRPHGFLCDTQGTLFYDTAEIIRHHQPKAFLLENVKNLERHDGGKTFATILNVLQNELGYQVQHRVINAASWVPQKRERIFIAGFRQDTDFDFSSMFVPPIASGPKMRDILEPEVDEKYTLSDHLWQYLRTYKEKHEAKGNGFGFGLVGPDDVARTLSARYHKDGSEILVEQKGKNPRRLTPRECARLMGFEKPGEYNFRIPVSDTQAYRQFGNSVVVPVVEAVARHMAPHIAETLAAPLGKVA